MTALYAYPLTPWHDGVIDEQAFAGLIGRAAAAGVDAITALGSTGGYPYLSVAERGRALRIALDHSDGVPVVVGAGALATRDVLRVVDDAAQAGAASVLVAPVSYQPLTRDEVYGLYEDVTSHAAIPVIVYDNPRTTGVEFDDELMAAVASLPGITGIKSAGVSADVALAEDRVRHLRSLVPEHVAIGMSGDPFAAAGIAAGYDVWHSVIAGTLPDVALSIMRGADAAALTPLWALMRAHGGMRVMAAIAEEIGWVMPESLPRPLRGIAAHEREKVASFVSTLRAGEAA